MSSATTLNEVWVAGEVLIDLIPDSHGVRKPIVGGGAANTAKALARLGIATHFIDGISSDDYGTLARKELEESGVNLSRTKMLDKPTALAEVSLSDAGGASYKFTLEGTATFDFDSQWLPRGNPKALHIGTLATIIEPGATALYEWAHSIDAPIVFDPNIRPSVLGDRVKYRDIVERWIAISDLVKLSDDDLFWLYPEAKNLDDAINIARIALTKGPTAVVITRGKEGISAVTQERVIHVPGVEVAVVDTVGAGDTVGAIIVEGIAHFGLKKVAGERLEPTLIRAAKAAAITCTRVGAQPPTLDEIGIL